MTENLWTKIQKIQYKGTPVFGRDSNPQNTSEFVAIAGTVLFWLLVLLFFIFAKPFAKKPEFKTVQIVLSSTPVAKTEKKESAASSAAAQKAQSTEKKIEKQDLKTVKEEAAASKTKTENKPKTETQKITETPKKAPEKPAAKSQPKPSEPKKTAAPAKDEPFVPQALDMTDGVDFFANAKKVADSSNADWTKMFDSDNDAAPSTNQPTKVENKSSMEDVAGKISNGSDTGLSSSVQSDNYDEVNTVGSETSKSLEGIKSVKPGIAGEFSTNIKDINGNGSAVSVSDGFGHSGRSIISSEPINISEKNAETITSNLTFEITFKIQPSGVVAKSDIEFESKANIILTDAVIDEIKTIIARWTFSSASNISVAKFSLTIQRR